MRRVLWFCLPAAVLFVLLPGAATAKTAAAPSCGDTILTSITLTANLDCSAGGTNGLNVGANGIVIDLNGHSITGGGGGNGYAGIYNPGFSNVIVKHGTIRNFFYGYSSANAQGEAVRNLTVVLDGVQRYYGLYIRGGSGGTYSHNTVTNAYMGVGTTGAIGNTFAYNTLTGNYYGASEDSSQNERWTWNKFSHSTEDGYAERSGSTSLTYNVSSHNGSNGFNLYCGTSATVVVKYNTANYNPTNGITSAQCFTLSSHSLFRGNKTNHDGIGILSYQDVNARFILNIANLNTTNGFYLHRPYGYVFTKNVSNSNGGDGVYFYTGSLFFPSLVTLNTSSSNGGYGYSADLPVTGTGNHGTLNALGLRHNLSG